MCVWRVNDIQAYPVQLQKMLNDSFPGKFSIVDCGIGGATLETIFANLDHFLKKYRPDIAVCMMGNIDITESPNQNQSYTTSNRYYGNKTL
jgi:predicted oxidoreductase